MPRKIFAVRVGIRPHIPAEHWKALGPQDMIGRGRAALRDIMDVAGSGEGEPLASREVESTTGNPAAPAISRRSAARLGHGYGPI